MTSFGFDIPFVFDPPAAHGDGALDMRAPGFSLVKVADVASVLPAWRDLFGRTFAGNPFFHPDFLLPAIKAFGGGRVELATVWGIDGRLLLLVPVVTRRLGRLAPSVAVWCHDFAPLGTPLVDADMADHALSCLAVGIGRQFGRHRSLTFPYVDVNGGFAKQLGEVAAGRHIDRIDEHRRARFDRTKVDPDPRNHLETRRRKEFARQLRRLAECGSFVVETVRDGPGVAAAFEEFLALEAAGWKGESGTAIEGDRDRLDFARAAVAGLAREGLCQIDALRLDGRPVAMLVSFIAGGLAVTWKIAHDEALGRFSPGAQLMLEAPRCLFDNPAVRTIDSLATADHPMIDRLWQGRSDMATLVLSPAVESLFHVAGLILARLEVRTRRRFGPAVKRLLASGRR